MIHIIIVVLVLLAIAVINVSFEILCY